MIVGVTHGVVSYGHVIRNNFYGREPSLYDNKMFLSVCELLSMYILITYVAN